ncbi:NAD-capped RNA hydrolase NUDT12-like [Amphiura filiformis]|uniref:NAD-capped RNA hydrolase NUDT12-like n=1 Tax=Amphiura filiformis TaxID=82378 RepID=UPI003B21A368
MFLVGVLKHCEHCESTPVSSLSTMESDIPGSPDITKRLSDELLKSASSGDVARVTRLLAGLANVNVADAQGWTSLMFASRNGHEKIVRLLLEKGCNISLVNKSGQTALEIADFWNQSAIIHLLINHSKEPDHQHQTTNYFGHNPLDRSANKRTDKEWLAAITKDPKTKFLLFSQSSPYVKYDEDGRCHLCPFSYSQVSSFLDSLSNPPISVLLGLGCVSSNVNPSGDSNQEEQSAWFALDVSNLEEEQAQKINPDVQLMSLKNPLAMMAFQDQEAGVVAQARSMLEWHDRCKYCPTCGSSMTVHEAGYKRKCEKQDCHSNRGIHNTSYPRTDPAAIMIVISPDGTKCLLGRKKQFPRGMYSCLAGFMEPGETIEDAVRREVHEESGIRVGKVEYHSSQPWPMPSQLMIGCIAHALTTDITIDKEELEDARWFPKQQVAKSLQGRVKGESNPLFFPPWKAIAHQLIKAWIGMSSSNL